MFATVPIPAPAGAPLLAVPAAAVQHIDGRPVAFVQTGGGAFEKRDLTLGRRAGEWFEVAAGLAAGEKVVTEGSFLLKSEAGKGELEHHED
jgi:cobalt-zinc-cadmium efflux system membrane fusion protein